MSDLPLKGDQRPAARPATGGDPLVLAFGHLALLRRELTKEQIRERAVAEMWNLARLVTRKMDLEDHEQFHAEMVDMFMRRLWHGSLLANFKGRGSIDAYLYTAMKFIALECRRARARRRMESRGDQSSVVDREPAPSVKAEQREQLNLIRVWMKGLPPLQRKALARRVPHLRDFGGSRPIPNERVNFHRAMKKLRQIALELDKRRA
jgi:DNA-directed RNA polymerase specialized sigma24 family protein